MDFKRLISHFTYRIEPKPDGGFIARSTDPSVQPIEAATREELQQKMQANIVAAIATEFPGLKVPLDNKEVNFAFHIEHKPDGGFILNSTDGKELPIVGSTHAEIESKFAEKLFGALGTRLMPELSKALAAGAGSGDVKVIVNRNVGFSVGSPRFESTPGSATAVGSAAQLGLADAMPNRADDPQLASLLNAGNSPITPEASRIGPIVRLLLATLIFAAIFYFLTHR